MKEGGGGGGYPHLHPLQGGRVPPWYQIMRAGCVIVRVVRVIMSAVQ